ncbi:hypothetical protein K7G98_34075, partial [Saccharothrix sp. MB29]|nr:hypothetical protein [Saccharothrix sp. MB29]
GRAEEHLAAILPEQLLPAEFSTLDRMPLTSRGKIDRARLPRAGAVPGGEHLAPRTESERLVARAWAAVLGREEIGIREKFFEAGGSSLTLVQLSGRLSALDRGSLSVATLLDHPTIEQLAARMDRHAAGLEDYEL